MDAFRIRFRVVDGEPRQYVDRAADVPFGIVDVRAEPDPRAAADDPAEHGFEPYSALVEAEREYKESPGFAKDREHWRTARDGVEERADRAGSRARLGPGPQARATAELDVDDDAALRAAARNLKTSFAVLVIAAAAVHEHRTSGARDVVLGISVPGRAGRQGQHVPGIQGGGSGRPGRACAACAPKRPPADPPAAVTE